VQLLKEFDHDRPHHHPIAQHPGLSGFRPQRNKVLRNTYGLLSLSLLPTVAGAWLGVATGIGNMMTGLMGMLVFLAIAFGFIYAIEKTKNSAAGVPVLLGFTFFMGIMLSALIGRTLGYSNGPQLVMTAFGGTAGVFLAMSALASSIKRDISGMGQWLFMGVVVLLIGGLINMFFQSSVMFLVMSVMSIGIFSAFMVYDLKRIIDGGETNYISATLALYLEHHQRVPEPAVHPGHLRRRARLR
jgi:modulator of FtsH protease